jgi:transmembrane 9 superfamily member 2/4
VNKLYSTKTLIPIDYYRHPFCQPDGGPQQDHENNLGEFLAGDRVASSPYLLLMKKDMFCEHLCTTMLGRTDQKGVTPSRMLRAIRQGYHSNWIVDNLPAAGKVEDDMSVTTSYWGFPVGFVSESDRRAYIHNHVNIEILYQKDDKKPDKYRIVRFTVEPFSIRHDFTPLAVANQTDNDEFYLPRLFKIKNPISSCDPEIVRAQHNTPATT